MNLDARFCRCVAVRDLIAVHNPVVAGRQHFIHTVVNNLTVSLKRKSRKGECPVGIRYITRDSFRSVRCCIIILIQVNNNAVRSYAVLVAVIIPYLGQSHFCFCRCVRIGNRYVLTVVFARDADLVACCCIAGQGSSHHLFDGVKNRLAVSHLIEIGKAVYPSVCCVQNCSSNFSRSIAVLIIGHQSDCYARRLQTILVICVYPDFSHVHARLSRRACIGDIHSVVGRLITVTDSFFLYGVGDFDCLAGGRIPSVLRKIVKRIIPAVSRPVASYLNRLTRYRDIVGQKRDSNHLGSDAVLVVCIRPGLSAGEINCRRCVRVGYRNVICIVCCRCNLNAVTRCCVTVYDTIFYFFNGITDRCSVFIQRQVLEVVRPVIARTENHFFYLCAVCQQVNRYGRRSDAVLVVMILPVFAHDYVGLTRCVAVCDVVAVITCLIPCNSFFSDTVGNQVAIFILRQVFKAVFPVSVCIRRDCQCASRYICSDIVHGLGQNNRDARRSYSVAVICIIPSLGAGHLSCLRCVFIGHRETILISTISRFIIARNSRQLYDRVLNQCRYAVAVVVLIQIFKRVCPVICI